MARRRLGTSFPRVFEKARAKETNSITAPRRRAIKRVEFVPGGSVSRCSRNLNACAKHPGVCFGMSLPGRIDATARQAAASRMARSAPGEELDRRKDQEPDITRANPGTGLHSAMSEARFRSER